MRMRIQLFIAAFALAAALLMQGCQPSPTPVGDSPAAPTVVLPVLELSPIPPQFGTLSGVVVDEQSQPVEGATVRIQTTHTSTLSDAKGIFLLAGMKDKQAVTISAWKEGYYCAKMEQVIPPLAGLSLTLRLYQTNDNPAYEWVPPISDNSCYSCKPGVTQVWLDNDAHGKSAQNARFLSIFLGTDLKGNPSPLTKYASTKDYGRLPLPPDPNKPYYGPGYRLDFPDSSGNCSACHLPGAAMASPLHTDPTIVEGVDSFGIHCDFCHKIADVPLDPVTRLPYPNMPGVLSMDVRRPFSEDEERYQLFFGTFDDDNVPQEDTRLPLIEQS